MTNKPFLIENETLSISISPRHGGTPHGLLHKPTNTKVMTDLVSPDSDGWVMGGSPYLFPFAGRVYGKDGRVNCYELGGKHFEMPIHGFASRMPWKVKSSSKTAASLALKSNSETLKLFPFCFELTNTFELITNKLVFKSTVKNLDPKTAMPISPGWHPFFCLQNSAKILPSAQSKFFEVNDKGVKGEPLPSEVPVSASSDDPLSLIIEDSRIAKLLIDKNPAITLIPDPSFKVAVLWKPAVADFVCVEPWSRRPNMIRTPLEMIEIAPLQTATFINSFSVD